MPRTGGTCIDVPAMEQHGIFHNGQPQAGSAQLPASPLVHPIETLEDAPQVLRRHSHPVVAEGEVIALLILRIAHDVHVRAVPGIRDGVVHQVAEDGIEQR